MTSKGQITIPATVRRALGLEAGDRVVFRLAGDRVLLQPENQGAEGRSVHMEKIPSFFDLAGSVPLPAGVDPYDWPAQRDAAWDAEGRARL